MAYVSQENKKRLAGICKTALAKWPGMKWTLSVRHNSTIVLTIAQGDIDFSAAVVPSAAETSLQQTRIDNGHVQINEYYIERDWSGAARDFLMAAKEALGDGNYDHSDIQQDVFNVGWYVDINIGRWNKPYRFTGAAAAPAPEPTPAPEAAPAPMPELEQAPELLFDVKHAGEPTDHAAQVKLLAQMNEAAANIEPEPAPGSGLAEWARDVELLNEQLEQSEATVARLRRESLERGKECLRLQESRLFIEGALSAERAAHDETKAQLATVRSAQPAPASSPFASLVELAPLVKLAAPMVEQATSSASGFAMVKIGSVEVRIDSEWGSDERKVTVNWPGIGAKAAFDALAFAADLLQAGHLALMVEHLLKGAK